MVLLLHTKKQPCFRNVVLPVAVTLLLFFILGCSPLALATNAIINPSPVASDFVAHYLLNLLDLQPRTTLVSYIIYISSICHPPCSTTSIIDLWRCIHNGEPHSESSIWPVIHTDWLHRKRTCNVCIPPHLQNYSQRAGSEAWRVQSRKACQGIGTHHEVSQQFLFREPACILRPAGSGKTTIAYTITIRFGKGGNAHQQYTDNFLCSRQFWKGLVSSPQSRTSSLLNANRMWVLS